MAAEEQQLQWLSAALVQADLHAYISEVTAWMSSERAIVADFCRSDTIEELGKALKLTNTQVQRLRTKIEALSPVSIPLPGIEVSLRDKSPDVDDDEIVSWRPPSPSRPDQNRVPAPPLHSGATSATARPSTPSKRTELRLCSIHGKMRDPEKTYQLSNGNFSCNKKHECITVSSQPKTGKEGARSPKAQHHRADSSLRPARNSRRGRSCSRSRSRGRHSQRRRASGSPARTRHPSPGHMTLSSPLAIAASLFHTMDTNPAKLAVTEDGFYRLKDLMNTWGRKHHLSKEEVLSAIACSLFKVMKKVDRANFLVWQNDDADADILLSIPVPAVR
jgi:hypothetical protein